MKTTMIFLCLVLLTPVLAQTPIIDPAERESVIGAARDYMEGAHTGDASRIERSCHPEFNKVSVRTFSQTNTQALYKAGYSRMLELVRADMVPLENAAEKVDITIYAVTENIASVLAESPEFHDYLHLVKVDEGWKFIQACWRRKPDSGNTVPVSEEEKEAVRRSALDYIEGWFSCDPDRLSRSVHPSLHKVYPVVLEATRRTMINHTTASFLVEGARAKVGALDKKKWNIRLRILDIQPDIAAVEILSARYYDYLHLVKIDGRWKIVNVLWNMNPEAAKS